MINRLKKIVRLNALEETPFPTSVTTAKLVVYVKRLERHHGDPPKNLTLRIPPFKVTSRSLEHSLHGAIGYL